MSTHLEELKKVKYRIHKLDISKASDHLKAHLDSWGYFTALVVNQELSSNGRCFCFAPEDTTDEILYDFNTSLNEPLPDIWLEKVLKDFIVSLLNRDRKTTVIIENNSFDPDHKYILNSKLRYSLANDVIFYQLPAYSSSSQIEECFKFVGGYGFFPIVVDSNLPIAEANQNVVEDFIEEVLGNTCMFFSRIYDSMSFMFWVKDGYDSLLVELQAILDNHTNRKS